MSTDLPPVEHFNNGQLTKAINSSVDQVRDNPSDTEKRWELAVYLCFGGELERAQKHVKVMMQQAPDLVADALLLNSLLKGEAARQQFFTEGRLPNFPEQPSSRVQQLLKGHAEFRDSQTDGSSFFDEVAKHGNDVSGSCDGKPFTSFRDVDGQTSIVLEAITIGGDYYWLEYDEIRQLELSELNAPQDVLWRQAEITMKGEQQVSAYLPSIYYGSHKSEDEALKLGRAFEQSTEASRAVGGKMLLVDGVNHPLCTVHQITFN